MYRVALSFPCKTLYQNYRSNHPHQFSVEIKYYCTWNDLLLFCCPYVKCEKRSVWSCFDRKFWSVLCNSCFRIILRILTMLKSRCCVLKKQQTVTRFQHGFRVLKKSFCFRVVLIAGEGPKFLKVMLVLQKNYKNFFTGGDIWYLRSLRTAHPSARGGGWRPGLFNIGNPYFLYISLI